jgi:hypothetical protein
MLLERKAPLNRNDRRRGATGTRTSVVREQSTRVKVLRLGTPTALKSMRRSRRQ